MGLKGEKGLKGIWKRFIDYLVKTLNGMALGLFSTLIISVIIRQLGNLTGISELIALANALRSLMGIGIGIGVAHSLQLSGLKLLVSAVAGGVATQVGANDPVVAYLTTIAVVEFMRHVMKKKTPIDILLIPLAGSLIALGVALLIGQPVQSMMQAIGEFVRVSAIQQPFIVGVVVAVVMGMALTAPISSAAIAIAITLDGIGGGAAVIGGAVQMIGFAVMSRKDNNIGGVLSVAFGTSMLQFKNIIKKPIIWLPTIIVSAILGPVSTVILQMSTDASGSGMGTSGLVGQIATIASMGGSLSTFLVIALMHFVLPIVLVLGVDLFFRKMGWIKLGDLSLKEE